ncbi:MAG: class I SAM-dependent methyltransferase [Chloroflexota bacterium]
MSESIRKCPLCGGEHSIIFDRREFRSHTVINRLCQNCGLVFQSPRMTEAELAGFYLEEYRRLQEDSMTPTARNVNAQTARAESLCDFSRPILPLINRHLDIGCSTGILLQHFQRTYKNQAVGVEPGEAHRMYACKKGLTVYASLEDLEKAAETRFDLVSMSHVLEHLPDPIGYLTHLREHLLTPDGWLLLEIPNLYAHDSFEVAHLYAFSPHTLREVLRWSGFDIVKLEKHGRPNSQLFPLFLTILCQPVLQPDVHPVHPERGVVFKRRAGMLWRRILSRLFPKRAWLVQG